MARRIVGRKWRQRHHRHSGLLDREAGERLVVDPYSRRGEVDDQEISRRARQHRKARANQPVAHPITRARKALAHRLDPAIALGQPIGHRGLQIGRRGEGQELVRARRQSCHLGRRRDPADLPPGEREDFPRRPAFDRPRRHPVERRKRDEVLPVEQQMLPHFIADDDQLMLARDARHRLQLGGVEQPSGRIVRIVEDDCASPGRDRRFDRRMLYPPSRRRQRDLAHHPARAPHQRGISIIGRGHHDHFVARLDRGEDRRRQRFGRPRRHAHPLGAEIEPVMPPIMIGDRLAQHRQSARRGILVRPFAERRRRGIEDRLGPAKVGKPLPQIDRLMLRRSERHPLEHARLHGFVKRVHWPRCPTASFRSNRLAGSIEP